MSEKLDLDGLERTQKNLSGNYIISARTANNLIALARQRDALLEAMRGMVDPDCDNPDCLICPKARAAIRACEGE